jgi:hypothetical protein
MQSLQWFGTPCPACSSKKTSTTVKRVLGRRIASIGGSSQSHWVEQYAVNCSDCEAVTALPARRIVANN